MAKDDFDDQCTWRYPQITVIEDLKWFILMLIYIKIPSLSKPDKKEYEKYNIDKNINL